MRVIITGGGTGGHVNPALAIANTIKQNDPDSTILYVGTEHGIESKLVPKAGYEIKYIDVRGLNRRNPIDCVKALAKAASALRKSRSIVKNFRPDIVIGTGGYVCWPVVDAAASLGIPTALHESNAIAGVAVKMLQKKVDRIFLNFDKTADSLKCDRDKLMRVGNPVMNGFSSLSREKARERLGISDKYKYVLLSFAGSMGAEKVNDAILALMREFTAAHPEVCHIHATGAIERELCTSQFKEMGLDKYDNIELCEYIYDMPLKMAAADLTINRAGAMTISELATTGKSAIFIPSPNVAENHQYKNAKVLADADAAGLFEEKELVGGAVPLIKEVERLLSPDGDEIRSGWGRNIRAFAVPEANKLIYNEIRRLAADGGKSKKKQ